MLNKYIFLILSDIVALVLLGFIIKVAMKKSKTNNLILGAMIFGLIDIPVYCITVISRDYKLSYIAFTAHLILTGWLTFLFLKYVANFSISKRKTRKIFLVFLLITIVDTIILFVNIFYGFLFGITLERNAFGYQPFQWNIDYKFYSAFHFILAYLYIITTIGLLLRSAYKVSSFYKMRYIGILIAYVVVIAVHVVCVLARINIDFSILLYGMMGAFTSYYIAYTAPNQLLFQVLQCYNETADDAMLYFDEKGRLLLANNQAKKIFTREGVFSKDEAEDYCSNVILRYVKIKHEPAIFKDSMIIAGDVCDFEGEYREFFDKRNLIGSFLRLENKTQENIRYKKQQYIANNDPLTGIYNRDYFFTQVDSILKKDPYTPRLMICSNIVDFKLINEILGTDFGDNVLKKTAEMIRKLSRADDLYCRMCDDKFAVFMRKTLFDPQVFSEAFKVIQRLTENELFQVKIAIGIYEVQGDRESGQVMYDKAYMAMEQQDENSKQVFHFYDAAFTENIIEEKNMVSVFDENLSGGKFKIYYSPIKNPQEELVILEADSKWEHEEKGLLNSKEYVGILEKYGIIYKLDCYIWDEATKFLAEINKKYNPNLMLQIQVSVRDFYYIDIYETLVELVKKNNCNPNNIIVEFLEKSISQDFREINAMFKKMQEYGFHILFNNFGNGQTSLNLLKETNLNGVKIDAKFIEETINEEKSNKIMNFIISLSNMLGLIPGISGVDTKEQFESMKKLKIQRFQGLYCGEERTSDRITADFYS